MLRPRGSFVPRRRGWTSRSRRLSFASTTSPGYAASSPAHRILWRPHPSRRTPLWLHCSNSGSQVAHAFVVASRHHFEAGGTISAGRIATKLALPTATRRPGHAKDCGFQRSVRDDAPCGFTVSHAADGTSVPPANSRRHRPKGSPQAVVSSPIRPQGASRIEKARDAPGS
jgi:hypothetical protein